MSNILNRKAVSISSQENKMEGSPGSVFPWWEWKSATWMAGRAHLQGGGHDGPSDGGEATHSPGQGGEEWSGESRDSENSRRGASWWSRGWEFAWQCRGHRFDPCPGRFLMTQGTKATWLEPTTREAITVRSPGTSTRAQPRSPQLEKALYSEEDPAQPKTNNFLQNI